MKLKGDNLKWNLKFVESFFLKFFFWNLTFFELKKFNTHHHGRGVGQIPSNSCEVEGRHRGDEALQAPPPDLLFIIAVKA